MTEEVTQIEHIELQLRALEKEAANTLWTGSSLLKGHALLVREALTATAALADENAALKSEVARLREALKPFADCCDYIRDDEDDEEWAKFRLLIKNYRLARQAMGQTNE